MTSFLRSEMAEQPRSPLGGLDLDTAIRLRWALRDIKAKRTKLSPDKFLKPSPHKRRKSGHAGRSESGQNRKLARLNGMSGLPLPAQPVDATQALNLSAGVSNCKVSRGRSLS